MLTFSQHRLKFQAKNASQIPSSPITSVDKFKMPVNAMIHFRSNSVSDLGMRGNNTLLFSYDGYDILSEFITDIVEKRGRPTERALSSKYLTGYYRSQFRIKRNRRMERVVVKPKSILVQDYSVLPIRYTYRTSLQANWYEHGNLIETIVSEVNKYHDKRDHFIPFVLPSSIPTFEKLSLAKENEPTDSELNHLIYFEEFLIRELWLLTQESDLLDAEGNNLQGIGLLSKLKSPERVNILIQDAGNVISLNVGLLLERASNSGSSAKRDLYRLLEGLAEKRTPIDSDELPEIEAGERISLKAVTPELESILDESMAAGTMTSSERARMIKLATQAGELPNPFGEGTIDEFVSVTEGETGISSGIRNNVKNKSVPERMLKSRTDNFKTNYIDNLYRKDIVRAFKGLNRVGIVIKDLKVEQVRDAANKNDVYTFSYVMPNGKAGTQRLRIPEVERNGTFKANGVKYVQDSQKIDIPIRKVKPSRVALTSYYGKLFIYRSELSSDSRARWLTKHISAFALDAEDKRVTKALFSSNDIPTSEKLPLDFTALIPVISSFKAGSVNFDFNLKDRENRYKEADLKAAKKAKLVICGANANGLIGMRDDNVLYELSSGTPLGFINDVVGGHWSTEPQDKIYASVFGKKLPLGLILGRYIGIDALIKTTGAKVRKVNANVKAIPEAGEYRIRFKDVTLLVDSTDRVSSMLLAGFNRSKDSIKDFNYDEFNRPDVYTNLFSTLGAHHLAIRELKLMREAFIDPITEEILLDMKEPHRFIPLLFKAADLLKDDRSPDETDPEFMRIRGYERVSGAIYKTFIDSVRVQRGSPDPGNTGLEIRTNAVWQFMVGDQTTQLVQEINPTHTLKERSAVSLTGEGGRDSSNIMLSTRVFHKKDVGIFSEAGVDSAKVGTKQDLVADASLTNLRGMMGKYDSSTKAVGALSVSGNVLPGLQNDDKHLFCRQKTPLNCGDSLLKV